MKRTVVYLFLLSVVLYACSGKKTRSQMLIGSWHAISFANPDMDSFYRKSQLYIDTVGKHNDNATNIRLYGVSNIDSMRGILQGQFDTARQMQMNAVLNTTFTFRKDSLVILSFNGGIDSSKWALDRTGAIVLADINAADAGDKLRMEVMKISDTLLTLKLKEDSSFSIVTFRHGRK